MEDLLAQIRQHLFSAVLGDVLDGMGFRRQFLPKEIRPLRDDMVVVGRAMPVLHADLEKEGADPFGKMLLALDDLKPGEVYLAAGASQDYALWGELMSTRAQHLGAAGAVMSGMSRDTPGILALNFPTFSIFPSFIRTLPRIDDLPVPSIIVAFLKTVGSV